MIKSLFKQASTLARLQSGPLAQELPLLAEALDNERYPPETIRRYVRVADKFGRWLCKRGLNITEVDEATLARYRGTTGRRKNGQLRAAGRTLVSVAAKKGTSLAVETEPGVGLRSGLGWAQE